MLIIIHIIIVHIPFFILRIWFNLNVDVIGGFIFRINIIIITMKYLILIEFNEL